MEGKRTPSCRLPAPLYYRTYLGKMSPERAPGPHLDPANRLHGAGGLGQGRVAGRLPALPDGVLELLRLLAQLLQLVHGGGGVWYSLSDVSALPHLPPPPAGALLLSLHQGQHSQIYLYSLI